jgi:hypothetical protein
LAAIVIPFLAWMRWWEGVVVFGGTLVMLPGIAWREARKEAMARAARGLLRPDAPGRNPVAEPTLGSLDQTIIGRMATDDAGLARATGQCCDRPDWIEAYRVTDEHQIPCPACGQGVMFVSEHSIH